MARIPDLHRLLLCSGLLVLAPYGCANAVLGSSGDEGDDDDDDDEGDDDDDEGDDDDDDDDDQNPPPPGLTSSTSGDDDDDDDPTDDSGDTGEGAFGPKSSACGHGGYERVVEAASREPEGRQSCGDAEYSDDFTPGYEVSSDVAQQTETILSAMDLTAKANQMRGTSPVSGAQPNFSDIFRTLDDDTFGLRGFKFRDGPRGVSLEAGCPSDDNCWSTTFPSAILRGSTFDVCLENDIGRAQGDETLASGNTMMLAPMVNLIRHSGWGRSQEGYSEDPFVSGRMGSAYIVGLQEFIPACVKHYIANNIENGRETLNVDMDEQTIMEIYGRAFEMSIRDAGSACVMVAYNMVNGTKNTQNGFVLSDMLRDRFEFEGMTLSDWWAMPGGSAASGQQVSEQQQTATGALLAGLDMELPWAMFYAHIEAAVSSGAVPQAVVDEAARRIIRTKLMFNVDGNDLGLASPTTGYDTGTSSITNNSEHVQLAYNAAAQGMVLLKNENDTLPVARDSIQEIAVLSATVPFALDPETTSAQAFSSGTVNYATTVLTGDEGSSRMREDPALAYSPLEGFEARAGSGVNVVFGEDVNAASNADFIVVMAGLNAGDEGEEYTGAGDRGSFALDDKIDGTPQNDLIQAAAATGKPMVVVLIGGGVIDMPWIDEVPAVLMAWYPGIVGGLAIADIVFGDVNPSGKLPITWAPWGDMPNFALSGNAIDQEYFVGYRYFENEGRSPTYPMGHGLSYTSFEYQNLEVPCSAVGSNGVAEVRVDVVNTGDRGGHDTVFMFASYPDADDPRKRVKKLQGFYRVFLEAGQVKQVAMPLRVSELRFWDEGSHDWVIEPGMIEIEVGGKADDLPLSETLVVE